MSIKCFVQEASFTGYSGDPPLFGILVPFSVYQSDGGENNGPKYFQETLTVNASVGDSPTDVFEAVYAAILTNCANFGYDTPTKADIFAYAPISMTVLLPDA